MKIFATLSLILSLLSACGSWDTVNSSDVNQKTIFRTYRVTYNEDEQLLSRTARFRVGGISGTTLNLHSPSTVQVDGRDMVAEEILGTLYRQEATTGLPPQRSTFTWTDENRHTSTDEIETARPVRIA